MKFIDGFKQFVKEFEKIPGDDRKIKRLIFHNTEFFEYELTLIEFLKEKLIKKNIKVPKGMDDGTLLRFLYSSYFDQEKTCECLKSHFEWLEKIKKTKNSEGSSIYFQNNFINFIGRDEQHRPTILFDLKNLEFNNIIQEMLLEDIETLFLYSKKYLLCPGVIEKWNIIIDLSSKDFMTSDSFDFNIIELMAHFIKITENFPETLEKVFLINPNKEFVNIVWKPMEKDPKQKISGFSLPLNHLKALSEFFDVSIIPENFGGKCKKFPNLFTGFNKKLTSEDNMLIFDEMIKDLQNLEVEKKRKQEFRDALYKEVSKEKQEIEILMEFLKMENESLKQKL